MSRRAALPLLALALGACGGPRVNTGNAFAGSYSGTYTTAAGGNGTATMTVTTTGDLTGNLSTGGALPVVYTINGTVSNVGAVAGSITGTDGSTGSISGTMVPQGNGFVVNGTLTLAGTPTTLTVTLVRSGG